MTRLTSQRIASLFPRPFEVRVYVLHLKERKARHNEEPQRWEYVDENDEEGAR